MVCENCGQEVSQEEKFCPSCGTSTKNPVPSSQNWSAPSAQGFFSSLFDLNMREMITPKIIQILFIIGLILYGLFALISLVTTLATGEVIPILLAIIFIPIFLVLAIIMLRVYLEVILVLFRIYEEIKKLNQK